MQARAERRTKARLQRKYRIEAQLAEERMRAAEKRQEAEVRRSSSHVLSLEAVETSFLVLLPLAPRWPLQRFPTGLFCPYYGSSLWACGRGPAPSNPHFVPGPPRGYCRRAACPTARMLVQGATRMVRATQHRRARRDNGTEPHRQPLQLAIDGPHSVFTGTNTSRRGGCGRCSPNPS